MRRSCLAAWFVALASAYLTAAPPEVRAASPDVVISQVYGGGGNTGAPYTHDLVELFNRGSATVSLAGWSVQYASALGAGNFGATPTQITPLACNGGSTPCPPAALATIVDLVGYGNANFFEGSGAAPTLSNATAAFRQGDGCTDTDDNSADFSAGGPSPRNSASPAHFCSSSGPTGVGAANPSSGPAGTPTLLTVTVTPGTGPTSPIVSVSASLAAIGGASSQTFFDDGTNGDATPNDNVFSFQATVGAVSGGAKSLPFTITDALSRTGSGSIGYTVDPRVLTIPQIQGSGSRSPYAGQPVSTT